jgi:hypothetical protein
MNVHTIIAKTEGCFIYQHHDITYLVNGIIGTSKRQLGLSK